MIQLATLFLNILAPVFLLVLTGYLSGPRLHLEARTLSRLAYYILVPAFIFNVFSRAEIQAGLAARMTLYILMVMAGVILLSLLVARLLAVPAQMTAAFVMIGAFGNVGNFGLPVIQFKLGDAALVSAAVYFLVINTMGFIVGVGAATWRRYSLPRVILTALATPGILAVFPAVLANAWQLRLPLFLDRAVILLAGALIPMMLLTLGVQLSQVRELRLTREVVVASTLRLVAGPILALALAVPFALTGDARGAGVLQASMPAAVLTALIALEYDLIPDFVTTAVLLSTLASALTLTVVLALV